MKDINLTPKLLKKMNARPRTRGRYNSSELYFIINGKTTPAQWLDPPTRSVEEVITMWNGIGVHSQLEELMGKEFSERKLEFKYKGITLVAKVDFEPPHKPDEIWEFKSSERLMKTAKPWHEHQTKLYLTIFGKQQGVIYQPVRNAAGMYLKHLKTVTRDDAWFADQMEKLYQFHLEVEKLWNLRRTT